SVFRTDAVKYALVGLMRDLRGITMATNSRRTYGFLFDWLYPAHMPILLKGISHWTDNPEEASEMRFGDSNLWGCCLKPSIDCDSTSTVFSSWIVTCSNTLPCSHSILFGKEQGRLDQLLGTHKL
ncbi:exportin-7-B-like, partial [Trifolium medium]|nr:exportin-7-B-like [Trifolium medium]